MTPDAEPPDAPVQTPFAEAASPFIRTATPAQNLYVPAAPRKRPQIWQSHRTIFEFFLAMLAYMMFLLGSITAVQANPTAPWRYYVAVLPVVPAALTLWIFVRSLARMDELQKRVQMLSFGFSLGATALITFTYGFLEGVGLPLLNWTYILPLMAILWAVGTAYFTFRYR